jgi:hypothetical protein
LRTNGTTNITRRTVLLVVVAWLAAAVNVGASGLLARLPVPPPAIAIGLTAVLLLLMRMSHSVRDAAWSLGPKPLVTFHLTRIAAGVYFLLLYSRGVLPGEFAIPAGWGDIAVGAGALVVLTFCLPARTRGQRVGLIVWNTAGLLDILAVLGNGMRLFAGNAAIAEPFMSLPLALLPTFVVPAVIGSHVLLFGWSSARANRITGRPQS